VIDLDVPLDKVDALPLSVLSAPTSYPSDAITWVEETSKAAMDATAAKCLTLSAHFGSLDDMMMLRLELENGPALDLNDL